MTLSAQHDPMGNAIHDYFNAPGELEVNVTCSVGDDGVITLPYLFRSYEEMPVLEQIALMSCKGDVLDVGAGAGSHALYLQTLGHDVLAIDISELSVQVIQQRGVKAAQAIDFFDLQGQQFDTLLMMMNGIGFVQTLHRMDEFFAHAKTLLLRGGQIILDSTDVRYLYLEEDGSLRMDLEQTYYGEATYQMEYNDIKGEPFPWLFIDYDTLATKAKENGFDCEFLAEAFPHSYLAKLSLQS